MAAFFFWLGMLLQCGPFPMSPSDCEPRRSAPTLATTENARLEAP
jgi:hypothetical protein